MPQNVVVNTGPLVLTGSTNQRPNNTTLYDPGDLVGSAQRGVFVLKEVCEPEFGTGYIIKIRVSKWSATPGSFRLFVFNAMPSGSLKDGDPFKLAWNDHIKCIGWFDLTMITGGSTSDVAIAMRDSLRVGFLSLNNENALYCVLVATQAYTPAKNERFHVELLIEQGVVPVNVFDEPIATVLPA